MQTINYISNEHFLLRHSRFHDLPAIQTGVTVMFCVLQEFICYRRQNLVLGLEFELELELGVELVLQLILIILLR